MSVEPGKWGIIYSLKVGTRKVQRQWKEIKEYMDSKDINYDYIQSEGFGSVERLVKTLANNGCHTTVTVNGDGAPSDAINSTMLPDAEDKEDIVLGMTPNGMGNNSIKHWGPSIEYKPAINCIVNHHLRKTGVGLCSFYDGEEHQRRYSLSAVNIGLGARIMKITDQTRRFWGMKLLPYVAALFLLISECKLYRIHLRIGDERVCGCIITVCVGSAWGWGQTLSAIPYNGWLDASVIHRPEFLQIISRLWMLIQGKVPNHKVVKSHRTRKVKVPRAQNASVDLNSRLLVGYLPPEIGMSSEKTILIIPN